MSLSNYLINFLKQYKAEAALHERIVFYFTNNIAAQQYAALCEEKGWKVEFDHLTVRTHNIDKAAQEFEALGWKYDKTLEYKNEGWWAKIYRRANYPCMFIDKSYEEAPEAQQIVKRWVDKFGDREFHHIAMRLPEFIEIEEVIEALQKKGVNFPGKITGPKGTRLRQIFSQAELKDGAPFSVLELAQRGKEQETGKLYEGFISEQADSLMKDSVL
jgi:hypothetical protein